MNINEVRMPSENILANKRKEAQIDNTITNIGDVFTPGEKKNILTPNLRDFSELLLQDEKCRVLWEKETEGFISSSGVTAGSDGTLYHGSTDGKFYALDGKTGEIKWSSPIKRDGSEYSAPIEANDGTILIHSTNGNLYGFDPKNGDARFKIESDKNHFEMIHLPPAVTKDGFVYSNSVDSIKAYKGKKLKKIWEYPTSAKMSGVEAGKDGNVYFGDGQGNLLAIDGKTGKKIWGRPFDHNSRMTPSMTEDGGLYVPSFGSLQKVDPKSGKTIWEAETAGWAVGKPLSDGKGSIFIGDDGGNLQAIDCGSGKPKWEFKAASCIITSPVMDRNGSIYFTSYDGNLYSVDSMTGRKKWTKHMGGEEDRPRQPVIGPDGTIFLAVDEHHIKALIPWEIEAKNTAGEISDAVAPENGQPVPAVETKDNFVIIDGVKLEINRG